MWPDLTVDMHVAQLGSRAAGIQESVLPPVLLCTLVRLLLFHRCSDGGRR